MSKGFKSARGKLVDMDMLRLANESTIAVGNMKVNARGDQLGKGGKIIKTRAQVMAEYHKLNTPVADDAPPPSSIAKIKPLVDSADTLDTTVSTFSGEIATPIADDTPPPSSYSKPRGSFAESIAEQTEVKQELLSPTSIKTGSSSEEGPSRI